MARTARVNFGALLIIVLSHFLAEIVDDWTNPTSGNMRSEFRAFGGYDAEVLHPDVHHFPHSIVVMHYESDSVSAAPLAYVHTNQSAICFHHGLAECNGDTTIVLESIEEALSGVKTANVSYK